MLLLRRQSLIEQETLVRGSLATPEKAWVDLLRETRRSQLPIDYGELAHLLRAMTEYGINQPGSLLLHTAHWLSTMAPSRGRPASVGRCGATPTRGGLCCVSVAEHPELFKYEWIADPARLRTLACRVKYSDPLTAELAAWCSSSPTRGEMV
jgi:hypothetical protein